MLKLAILIKPNFKIKNLCYSTKKKFKIKYGKQKYLDHFPHVTINCFFHLFFSID